LYFLVCLAVGLNDLEHALSGFHAMRRKGQQNHCDHEKPHSERWRGLRVGPFEAKQLEVLRGR